jgi:tetratricopeptide (TPR) repeat protein
VLGLALLDSGDFERAVAEYDVALTSARETGDESFVDWIYACRSAAAAEAGPANDELVELKRILLRARDANTSFRAAYTASRIYEIRRDFKKALFYSRIACQHSETLGEPLLIAGSESQRGMLLYVDSRFEESAAAYRKALDVPRTPPLPRVFEALLKDNLGSCLIALDRIGEGLELVHESLDFLESAKATAHTVYPLLDLCFGYLKSDRYDQARYFGETGLERAPLSGEPSVEKNFLYLLGEACHLSGDAPSAQSYFDRLASHYPEFKNLRAYLEVFDFRNVINLRS